MIYTLLTKLLETKPDSFDISFSRINLILLQIIYLPFFHRNLIAEGAPWIVVVILHFKRVCLDLVARARPTYALYRPWQACTALYEQSALRAVYWNHKWTETDSEYVLARWTITTFGGSSIYHNTQRPVGP